MARHDDRPPPPRDPRLADRPTGRQPDPADTRAPEDADPDDLYKAIRSRPQSAVTDQTDDETEDGLDPTEEAVRRAAEDRPTRRRTP